MVEIQLTESENLVPVVIREPGETVKIILPMVYNSDELLAYLATRLSADELKAFINLWSEDTYPRAFKKEDDYLTIKDQR